MVWAKLWSMLRRLRRPRSSPTTRLHRSQDRPFDRIRHVAVVIKALEERPEQRHIGLVYRHEFQKHLKFLHLGWHNQLQESGGAVMAKKLPKSAREFFRRAGAEGGRKGGAKGGKATAANMTPEQKRERARKAGLARGRNREK